VLTHDFPSLAQGKAVPYGTYDVAEDQALVKGGDYARYRGVCGGQHPTLVADAGQKELSPGDLKVSEVVQNALDLLPCVEFCHDQRFRRTRTEDGDSSYPGVFRCSHSAPILCTSSVSPERAGKQVSAVTPEGNLALGRRHDTSD
jgi:hypothetical protein